MRPVATAVVVLSGCSSAPGWPPAGRRRRRRGVAAIRRRPSASIRWRRLPNRWPPAGAPTASSAPTATDSTGKGDGSGGAAGAPPADLTDATWDYGSTDGEIFGVIHDGTSNDMGSYAERLKDADIWNIVNYIRTLAA